MQAVIISDFKSKGDNLCIKDVESTSLRKEDVCIKVHAAALNRADLLQQRGLYPAPVGVAADIPGLECAGEICALGKNVRNFTVGERVMALLSGAGQAQEVVVHQDMVMKIPSTFSYIEAAAIPEVFITAYDALLQTKFSLGESILIHAAGSGVGLAAIQLARLAGARHIYGTASVSKLEIAQKWGMDQGINYQDTDFADAIGKSQVDVILEMVGAGYWQQNLHCIAKEGRIIVIGFLGGAKFTNEESMRPLLAKRIEIRGTVLRPRSHGEKAVLLERFRRCILPLFAEKRLQPVVDKIFPMAQVNEAYNYMRENNNCGKIILTW